MKILFLTRKEKRISNAGYEALCAMVEPCQRPGRASPHSKPDRGSTRESLVFFIRFEGQKVYTVSERSLWAI